MKFRIKGPKSKNQDDRTVITGKREGIGVFKTEKERTTVGGIAEPYKYKRTSIDTSGYSKGKPKYKVVTIEGEGDKTGSSVKTTSSKVIPRKEVPELLKKLNKKD